MTKTAILFLSTLLVIDAPGPQGPADPFAGLKQTYLACERRALDDRMPAPDAAKCSQVYEELKAVAFGGDWLRVRDWSMRALGVRTDLTESE